LPCDKDEISPLKRVGFSCPRPTHIQLTVLQRLRHWVLICSGTRDNFATPNDLTAVASKMPNASFHELDGADHGFAVLKRSGRAREDVWKEAADVFLDWFEETQN
jgi:predicted alpha/beta-hydrolase family hydrolase